jgi:hypothetical protein
MITSGGWQALSRKRRRNCWSRRAATTSWLRRFRASDRCREHIIRRRPTSAPLGLGQG